MEWVFLQLLQRPCFDMINNKLLGWSLFLFVFLSACEQKPTSISIRDYYYPIDLLKDPLVYEYKAINNDSLGSEYWYYRTVETDTATYLTGNYYDRFFTVRQFSNEEIVSNGSILLDYFLYAFDSLGTQMQVPAAIEYGNVFPFEVKDTTTTLLQKMKWNYREDPPSSTTLIRNRRYNGKTAYTFKGQQYECVAFDVRELVDDFNNGHWEREYSMVELYAKGIGLVYYRKEIEENFILEYELVDRYSMKTLEEKYNSSILSEE